MHEQKRVVIEKKEEKTIPSYPPMPLKPEAFKRPIEVKESEIERQAFLRKIYREDEPEYKFNDCYKDQIKTLCEHFYKLAKPKVDVENLSQITSFPQHLFGLIQSDPSTTPFADIKAILEKIVYLIEKKPADEKDAEEIELHKKMVLEMMLPYLRVCNTGTMGHLDFAYQYLTGGDTLEDVWSELRTDLITEFGYKHIREHKKEIKEGNEMHVPNVLRNFAQQKNWNIKSEMGKIDDHFKKLTLITSDVFNKLESTVLDSYQLRSMADSAEKKFEQLLKRNYEGKYPWEENHDWTDYQAEIFLCAQECLKKMGFAIAAGELFEKKDDDTKIRIRFTPLFFKQVFWRYCQRNDRYVDQTSWQEEKGVFANYRLMRAKAAAFTDLAWIEDKEGNVISFDRLPPEEQMPYLIYSVVNFDFPDRFNLLQPSPTLDIFKEKKDLVALAKAIETQNQFHRHAGLFKAILRKYPDKLAYMLNALSFESVSKILDAIEFDFCYLHLKDEMHEAMLKLLPVEVGLGLKMADLNKNREIFENYQKEYTGVDSPIPYFALLNLASVKKDDDQFIYKMYLQRYFPVDFQKVAAEEKADYAKAFIAANKSFISRFDEKQKELWLQVVSGSKYMTLKDAVSMCKWLHLFQHRGLLTHFYREAVKEWKVGRGLYAAPPLYWAVLFNQAADIDALLSVKDTQVNKACNDGETALHAAAWNGLIKAVEKLLDRGANANAAMNNGATPLYFAAQNGHLDTVRLLLENRANVNAAKNDGATPLYIAAQNGHLDTVRLLLENHANVNAAMNDGATPLYIAAQNGHLETVRLLLEYHANVNAAMNNGITPLFVAAQEGHLDTVRLLLEYHANVNAAINDGTTPLFVAAQEGHLDTVRLLLRIVPM